MVNEIKLLAYLTGSLTSKLNRSAPVNRYVRFFFHIFKFSTCQNTKYAYKFYTEQHYNYNNLTSFRSNSVLFYINLALD